MAPVHRRLPVPVSCSRPVPSRSELDLLVPPPALGRVPLLPGPDHGEPEGAHRSDQLARWLERERDIGTAPSR